MAEDTIRKQVSRELKRALSDAGLSARAAAGRMEVEPKTLYRWINEDNNASLENLALFAKHVGPIRLNIGGTVEAPDWAGAMEARIVSAVEANRVELTDALAAGFAEQADRIERELSGDSDGGEPDGTADQPPGGAGPRPTPAS